jgi:hypothetical protein
LEDGAGLVQHLLLSIAIDWSNFILGLQAAIVARSFQRCARLSLGLPVDDAATACEDAIP